MGGGDNRIEGSGGAGGRGGGGKIRGQKKWPSQGDGNTTAPAAVIGLQIHAGVWEDWVDPFLDQVNLFLI